MPRHGCPALLLPLLLPLLDLAQLLRRQLLLRQPPRAAAATLCAPEPGIQRPSCSSQLRLVLRAWPRLREARRRHARVATAAGLLSVGLAAGGWARQRLGQGQPALQERGLLISAREGAMPHSLPRCEPTPR